MKSFLMLGRQNRTRQIKCRINDLRPPALLALCLVLTPSLGCGSSQSPELGTVSGVVTVDGRPLEGAIIQFTPSLGRVSRARTGRDGKYELKYVGNEKGARLGEHKVSISTRWMDEDRATGKITQNPELLPPKYNSESVLTKTVVSGHNNFDFATTAK
jgi:hypothetical protein